MKYDVIVIGAGLSGLAAGMRLAHFDKKVCILERHDRVGGLNSYYSAGGFNIDVGLHAMTNFTRPGRESKSTPLQRLLRQLRLRFDDLKLAPQYKSRIAFPQATLEFTNEFDYFLAEVESAFPGQKDNLVKLVEKIRGTNEFDYTQPYQSAREVVSSTITEPLLAEMIFCPLMYYGNPREIDMEFRQFVIMFKAVFMEGFARPEGGMKPFLDMLVKRYTDSGGELRLESGVKEVSVKDGLVDGVILYDGSRLECRALLSSVGHLETIALCPAATGESEKPLPGKLSFTESINVLDIPVSELGLDASIIFYNQSDKFDYRRPSMPVDVSDGVICMPDNFHYSNPPDSRMVRITNRADYGFWDSVEGQEYYKEKKKWYGLSLDAAVKIVPDFRSHIKFYDAFTPRTIRQYTGHINGAVYGAPEKIWSGNTDLKNLFLCGTDQGFLGIVGSMLSGISVSNLHLLK